MIIIVWHGALLYHLDCKSDKLEVLCHQDGNLIPFVRHPLTFKIAEMSLSERLTRVLGESISWSFVHVYTTVWLSLRNIWSLTVRDGLSTAGLQLPSISVLMSLPSFSLLASLGDFSFILWWWSSLDDCGFFVHLFPCYHHTTSFNEMQFLSFSTCSSVSASYTILAQVIVSLGMQTILIECNCWWYLCFRMLWTAWQQAPLLMQFSMFMHCLQKAQIGWTHVSPLFLQ